MTNAPNTVTSTASYCITSEYLYAVKAINLSDYDTTMLPQVKWLVIYTLYQAPCTVVESKRSSLSINDMTVFENGGISDR